MNRKKILEKKPVDDAEQQPLTDDLHKAADTLHQRLKIEKIKNNVCFDYCEAIERLPQAISCSWKKTKRHLAKSGFSEMCQKIFQDGLVALNIFLESLGKELTKK